MEQRDRAEVCGLDQKNPGIFTTSAIVFARFDQKRRLSHGIQFRHYYGSGKARAAFETIILSRVDHGKMPVQVSHLELLFL